MCTPASRPERLATWAARLALSAAVVLAGARDAGAVELVQTLANPVARYSEFGWSLAASPDRAVVGAPFEWGEGGALGAAYVFDVAAGTLLHAFKSPLGASHYFGVGVGVDGPRIFVGARFAPLEPDPNPEFPQGAVFVYDGESGALERVLEPPPGGSDMGRPVVAQGGRVAVGGAFTSAAGFFEAVYVYDAGTGTLERTFVGSIPFPSAFGASVGLRGDRLLIGELGQASLFDLATGMLLHSFSHPGARSFGILGALDGAHVYVGSPSDRFIDVFDDTSGALLRTLTDPSGSRSFREDGLAVLGSGVVGVARDPGAVLFNAASDAPFGLVDLADACCAPLMPLAAAGDRLLVPTAEGYGAVRVYDTTGCGDGIVDPGEGCDDGNVTSGDGCDVNCTASACGNQVVAPPEQCDDGNLDAGDGCSATCQHEIRCGDGLTEGSEECDDANAVPDDGCTLECLRPRLGVAHFSVTWTSPRTGERVVEAEAWYPAMSGGDASWDASFGAARDATPTAGPAPVIVFSHGLQVEEYPGILQAYQTTLRRLALQGFVVVAIDHPQDTLARFGENLVDRPLDVKRVLDVLLDPLAAPSLLRGHVDPDRVGVAGQSYGGYTAFTVAANSAFGTRDPRVKAIAGVAPALIIADEAFPTIGAAALIVSGVHDPVLPADLFNEHPYELLRAPKYFVQYTDGDHWPYSDACESTYCSARQTDRYLSAFFKAYLANDPSEEALLEPGAEAAFSNIRFLRDRGPALLPGGRRVDGECAVELATQIPDAPGAFAPGRLACVDGAPCDGDPRPRSCGFAVRLCLNVVDRHLLGCAATDVASLSVRGWRGDPALAALGAAPGLPTSDRRCTPEPALLTVAIPPGRTTGRRVVRTAARSTSGTRDLDRFLLTCAVP
jgi:cysteine-rich repeat protein